VLAFALSLASSVSWGVSDFLGGLQSRRIHVLLVVLVSQAFGLFFALCALPVLADQGLPASKLAIAIGGGAAGGLGVIAFYRGMAIGAISVVTPIAGLGVAVPVVVGLVRGDAPATIQLVGVAIAVAAVAMIGYEDDPEHRAVALRPVLLAIVAALGFGVFFVAVDAAASRDAAWTMVGVRLGGVLVASIAVLVARPALAAARPLLPILAVVGFFDVLANTLYAVATTKGLLPVVAVGGSLYPAVAILLAHEVLGERLDRLQKAGVALALTGVVLIAAGT
jgi:drug/metabolite transporter (DMT)-like permease